jgi:diguanylate cyclase (GGDEF)-like protein
VTELLLWPLLPFLGGYAASLRRDGARDGAVPWAVWAGAAAGLAGWLADGPWLGRPWTAWLAAGTAWAVAAAHVFRQDAREREGRIGLSGRAAALQAEIAVVEKDHAFLRREVEKHERDGVHAFQVYSLAKSLTETLSWEGLVTRFSQVLEKVTGSSDFLLYLASGASGALEVKLQNGAWPMEFLPKVPALKHPQWVPAGGKTLLQVPLWRGEELLGVLWVRWAGAAHPPLNELEALFEHLLVGFQKAQLFARMESLSRIDGLTGVLRRQVLLDHVEMEWNRARLFKTSFSFMLVDVDHFKRVNDTHGHPAGDAVLARLGELLRQGVYETDYVGRYGGEEFGVLLSRAEAEGVRRKAEALRQRVAGEAFAAGWEKLTVTISVGLAHFPRDGSTVQEVLEAADKALYAAKDGGRNRVVDIADVR